MGFLSSAVGAIGGIASTMLGNRSARKNAVDNREWQEYMSNTSIGRRMQDLRNAGLNPLLATENASSGASTPSGATAETFKFNPQDISALASARLVKAQAVAQEQENSLFKTKERQLKAEADLKELGLETERVQQEFIKAKTLGEKVELLKKEAERRHIDVSTEQIKKNIKLIEADLNSISSTGMGKDIEFMSNAFSSPSRAVGAILGALGSGTARAINGLFNRKERK